MLESMFRRSKRRGSSEKLDPRIIREGGYQPTADPGPLPSSLVKPTERTPPENKAK